MINILDLETGINTNGTADSTLAFRAAFEYLRSQSALNQEILLPTGTYLVSDNILTLSGSESLWLRGEGETRTLLRAQGNGINPIFAAHGTITARQEAFFISQMQFSSQTQYNGPWFSFRFAGGTRMSHLLLRDFPDSAVLGIVVGESWWDSVLQDVDLAAYGVLGAGVEHPALWLRDAIAPEGSENCNNIVLDNCRLENLHCTAILWGIGARNNALRRCKIEGCRKGVLFAGSKAFPVQVSYIGDGSHFTHMGSDAISGQNGRALIIANNHFDGNGGYAIDLGNSENCVVEGNLLGFLNANINGIKTIAGPRLVVAILAAAM